MVESLVQTNLPLDNNYKLWEKYKKQLFKTLKIDQKREETGESTPTRWDPHWVKFRFI